MRSKSTALTATLFAVVVFTIPAAAIINSGDYTINGTTYTVTSSDDYHLDDCIVYITNGGVLSLGSYGIILSSLSVTISDSSYLVSASDDSTAAVTGDGTGMFQIESKATFTFDSTYLAELVAGTATEYTYQIFDSAVLSNSCIPQIYVNDSWQDTDGIASVTYDESAGTVTVTIAVPEPNAFGALAGISALALVAARRRRRSRKIA